MKINPNIFKAYDIRGIYPKEINEETAYLIGRAYINFLNKKSPKIVVGRDNRLSSPRLFKALTRGIIEQGANVIDIGLSTTPMLYFSVANFKFDGGINITASHNPFQYNGFKIVKEKAIPISEKTGLREIQKLAGKPGFLSPKFGSLRKKNILKDYLRFNLKEFNPQNFRSLKAVVDTANAVVGIVGPEIFKKVPGKIHYLFLKLDGRFPNHQPDPLVKKNLEGLQKAVKNKKANLGIAFDGDGDRVVFIDEKGEIISGDLISALISSLILKESPGQKILYDVRSSNIVPETIKKWKGIPVVSRIGHSFIKSKMMKENILFAGEFSGHFYHREHFFCEAPFFVIFKILEEISQSGKTLSALIKPFKKYYHSEEINFEVKNKKKVLKTLGNKFSKKGKVSKIDGLRIDFKDWWFNVRPSNTEPFLRLVIEAKTKKLMEEKKKEIIKSIPFFF